MIINLISIMRGVPDSIMNVNNPESVDTNDDSIIDELPIVQSSTNGLSQTENDNISTPRPSYYATVSYTHLQPTRPY